MYSNMSTPLVVRNKEPTVLNICIYLCFPVLQSESYVNQAIQMALQPATVYHRMEEAFQMMEKGQLKGQQGRDITLSNTSKALSGQFSAKLSHLKPFQGLKVHACCDWTISYYQNFVSGWRKAGIIIKAVWKKITMNDAITQTKTRQEKFIEKVGLSSWDEAVATLPQFIEQIESFKGNCDSEAFKVL